MDKNLNANNLDLSLLDNLSPAEKELALSILKEYAEKGSSDALNNILLEDYAETPVDILTFVDDYNYLGNAWHDAEGKSKLYPYWRKELIKIFPDNLTTTVNNAIFSGSRGRGKAQPLDSLIFTEFGYKKMGDIQIGDKVYGRDGSLHSVLGIFPQGLKPVYKVNFSDKSSVECSDEHIWHVRDNNDLTWKDIELKDIIKNGLIRGGAENKPYKECRYKIPLTQPLYYNTKEHFIDPYLMGCLIGDGCFSNSISLTTTDDEILNYFIAELEKNNYTYTRDRITYLIKNKNKLERINKYKDEICRLGLYKHTSKDKFIPDEYLFDSIENRIALLQGLLDTGGTITKDGSSISFSSASLKLANNLVFLVQSLGGTANIRSRLNRTYKYKGEIRNCADCYTVSLKLPKSICPFKLSRKSIRLNPKRIEPQRNIKSVEYLGEKECQCIYIDAEDHLYLTDNLIVTHNTEVAVLIAAYLLHRVLCLKDPVAHFHLKPTEKLVFAFMNIKLALAEEIGIAKFQNTIQSSPWFMNHGTLEGRTKKVWVPNKFNDQQAIDIKIGSQSDDLIGLPIYFCLDGSTPILTDSGIYNIEDLENKKIKVPTVSNTGEVIYSTECTVKETSTSLEEYIITLEDGTIIKCTPSHKFMLINGAYKEAQYLTETDELLDFIPYGYIYKTTNLINNKIYIGQHKGSYLDKRYIGSGFMLAKAINKYGKDNFKCEILELCDSKEHLNQREIYYINLYNSIDPSIGYNIASGGQGGDLGPVARQHISEKLKNKPKTQEHRKHLSDSNKGKHLSEDTKRKISDGNRGKKISAETKQKMSNSAKALNKKPCCTNKGMLAITDGITVHYIRKTDVLPNGWRFGNCHTAKPHNMSRYYADVDRRLKNSLAHSGEKNSMWGKGCTRVGGNNTNSHTRYYFEDNVFECRKDAVAFLKKNIDDTISLNLIRNIEHGTYGNRTLKKYQFIIDKLTWETK